MSKVKRFGDFFAAFGAFASFAYLFRQFMGYDFKEIEGFGEKLKLFLSDAPTKEYRFYAVLFLAFALSFVLSCALHKLPYITVAVSILPLIQTVVMFDGEYLYERPMVFVVASLVHIFACLFECIRRDREDNGRRAAWGVDLFGLASAAFCGYALHISKGIAEVDFTKISLIEKAVYSAVVFQEADISILKYFIITFCLLAAVRFVLRDLYYVDAVLASALAAFTVYKWNVGEISVFGSALCFITVIYAVGRIAVSIFCLTRVKEPEKIS